VKDGSRSGYSYRFSFAWGHFLCGSSRLIPEIGLNIYRLKNYYDILGVTPQSGAEEVKRAYRQLAVLLHPDKNPLPEAEAAFKEVNEAYEVLSDPVARNLYNQMLTQSFATQTPLSTHRDPAYRKRQEAGYQPQRPTGPSERVLLMQRALPLLKKLAWVGCAWCLLLWLDFFLPTHVSEEKVITDARLLRSVMMHSYKADLLVTDKKHHFPIRFDELQYFPNGALVHVHTSRLLGILVAVESKQRNYILSNLATIYRNFSFIPILLFLLSMVAIVKKWGTEFQFNLGVVTFLIMILNVIFLFVSIL
jgi:hypothetical protein